MPAKSAFIQLKFKIFLDLAFRRVLEQAVFTDVVPAWEENDRVTFRRDHKFQANAADVRFNFVGDLLADLFSLFVVLFFERIIDFSYEIDCIVLHAFFNVDLLLDLFSFSLFIPNLPFFSMLLDLFILAHLYIKKSSV